MRLGEYYGIVNPCGNDSLLVLGKNVLVIGLYIAGRAKAAGLAVTVRAVSDAASRITTEAAALEWAKANDPEAAQAIAAGSGAVSSSTGDLLSEPGDRKYNKLLVNDDRLAENLAGKLAKLDAISSGEKAVLFDLPLSFFRPFSIEKKGLLGAKTELLSFRQLLERFGLKVDYYEAHEKRLLCGSLIKKFNADVPKPELLDCDRAAAGIWKELSPHLAGAKAGLQFAVDGGEWLYFITTEEAANAQTEAAFVFLDGTSACSEKAKDGARKLTVAVLPNAPSFRRELGVKGAKIVKKEEAKALFAERK